MFPRVGLNAKSLCRQCQSSVAGLSWPGEVVHTDLAEEAKICTAKHITATHILLTRFGTESQQSFLVFQQIYHTCQLLKFRSGRCLSSCHFLGKKKHLPTRTHTRIMLNLQVQMSWPVCGLRIQMHPDVSESLHTWVRIALCLHASLTPRIQRCSVGRENTCKCNSAGNNTIMQQITHHKLSEYFWKQDFFLSFSFIKGANSTFSKQKFSLSYKIISFWPLVCLTQWNSPKTQTFFGGFQPEK